MRLRRVQKPFDDPDCIFELKHDGFRAVVYLQDGECKIISRNQSVAAWLEQTGGPKPRFLLEASVRRSGAEIRLTLHLMELAGGGSTHFSNVYRATINDIFVTQERLAGEIRGDISAALHIGKVQ